MSDDLRPSDVETLDAPSLPTQCGLLPGDPDAKALIDRIIRVDHAGEYGAKRIYEGQLSVLRNSRVAPQLRHMAEQENRHLEAFEQLAIERRVRPTLLQPLWHIAAFALGAGTALLGERTAMACTVAIEEVIDEHYAKQMARLGTEEAPLREQIEKFRAEEIEHRDTALAREAELAPGYLLLTTAIKTSSRAAIWLSERF